MPDPDVIDLAAGLAPGDPLHAARRFRAKVVEATTLSLPEDETRGTTVGALARTAWLYEFEEAWPGGSVASS